MNHPLIIIPARIGSTRLPRKPLAEVKGEPMILHVWRRAIAAAIAPVLIATDSQEVFDVCEHTGAHAVMTATTHVSGSDRAHEAASLFDPKERYDVIVNLQGDMPLISPEAIRRVLLPLTREDVDLSTVASLFRNNAENENPHVVKVIGAPIDPEKRILKAFYFTRSPMLGMNLLAFHHVGLYGFRRRALSRFVTSPRSFLEKHENLEQLRALENNMTIAFSIVDEAPQSVDVIEDLAAVRLQAAREKS